MLIRSTYIFRVAAVIPISVKWLVGPRSLMAILFIQMFN